MQGIDRLQHRLNQLDNRTRIRQGFHKLKDSEHNPGHISSELTTVFTCVFLTLAIKINHKVFICFPNSKTDL